MDVYEAALKRRSIRLFRETPVPYEMLEKCVDTARLAPSVLNQQVLEFLVVDDAVKLQQIYKNTVMVGGYSSGIVRVGFEQQPKAYIITLMNKTWASNVGGSRRASPYDVGMANENMMLFAVSEGLATCPILSYNAPKLREILELPEQYEIARSYKLMPEDPDWSRFSHQSQDNHFMKYVDKEQFGQYIEKISSWIDQNNTRNIGIGRLFWNACMNFGLLLKNPKLTARKLKTFITIVNHKLKALLKMPEGIASHD